MKRLLLLLICSVGFLISNAQTDDRKSILAILQQQAEAWNKGDIEGFMKGYWNNDSLMFIGKSGVTYGYVGTLDNYKKSYPDAEKMGRLFFDMLQVKKLSDEYFFVVGKWLLKRTVGDLSGHYTLLFRKINGKWCIVADHSS
jgi:ketosteroid isomerase-like protein